MLGVAASGAGGIGQSRAFRFDAARSAFYPPRMKAFPQNTEIETVATFASDNPGLLVNNVTPDGRAFTLRIHHSFLKAPEGYRPRPADPRIGSISGMVFTTQTAEEIEATYHELKSRGVHFTMELVRHEYGKGLGDQEARFVDPDGNEFLLHT